MIEVCIPMKDMAHLTDALVQSLTGYDVLRIFDNGSMDARSHAYFRVWSERPRVHVVHRPAATIYQMWNEALRLAQPGSHVAILNNDITVPDRFLETLSLAFVDADPDVWITYPNWHNDQAFRNPNAEKLLDVTTGTRNAGGMSGFAFMVDIDALRSNEVPPIDERFLWLCGDGDLIKQIEMREGRAAMVRGLGIHHIGQATSRRYRKTTAMAQADRELRRKKYL